MNTTTFKQLPKGHLARLTRNFYHLCEVEFLLMELKMILENKGLKFEYFLSILDKNDFRSQAKVIAHIGNEIWPSSAKEPRYRVFD
jgi:hypothetical protein